MTSLACCYRSETNSCAARREGTSPLCQRHLYEVTRAAIYEDLLPPDVVADLRSDFALRLAQKAGESQAATRLLDAQWLAQREAENARGRSAPVGYYVRLSGDRVKIGTTRRLWDRMATFRARPEDLLAIEPGSYDVEARRHRTWTHLAIAGRSEEFTLDDDLQAFIDEKRERYEVLMRLAQSTYEDLPSQVRGTSHTL